MTRCRFFIFSIILATLGNTPIPQQFIHKNSGCPENSNCSSYMGKIRQKWLNSFKSKKTYQKFVAQYGLPISYWAKKDQLENEKAILWDSPCKYHLDTDKNERQWLSGFSFFKNLKNNKDFIFDKAYYISGKELKSFIVPRSEIPVNIYKGKLLFLQEMEGNFYQFEISTNGKLSPSTEKIKIDNHEVKCPKQLVSLSKDQLNKAPDNLYQGHFCKSIYDLGTQKHKTFLFQWSCN